MSRPNPSVLIIGINYAPELIGVAPYTTGIATALAERGHQVQVFTGYPHYPNWRRNNARFRSDEVMDGVQVRRLNHPVPRRFSWLGRAFMELMFGLQIGTTRWGKPDVVILVTPPLLAAAMCVVRARLTPHRPAIGVLVQDIYSRGIAETGATSGLSARAVRFIESLTLKMSDGVSTIHKGFSQDLSNNLGVEPSRIREIRNWTHVVEPAPSMSQAFRDSRGWREDEVVVLHAGNMGYKQGLENVVAAARLAGQAGSRVRFVLLGDGNQRAELERHASDVKNLEFADSVSEEEFPAALGAADVLLVNERPGVAQMSVPSKLTSYFRSGRPVLAAVDPRGYAASEITAAGAGVCVPPGRPDLLLEEALRLGSDRHLASRLGAAGQKYCNQTLSYEAAATGYEQWIDWLADYRRTELEARAR